MQTGTVSSFLSMQGALNSRRTQLNELKNAGTQRTMYFTDNKETSRNEPTYSIKDVDKKLAAINKALFIIDAKVKEANAKTPVEADISFDELMAPLE